LKTWGELKYGVPEEDVKFVKHIFMFLGLTWLIGGIVIVICLIMGW